MEIQELQSIVDRSSKRRVTNQTMFDNSRFTGSAYAYQYERALEMFGMRGMIDMTPVMNGRYEYTMKARAAVTKGKTKNATCHTKLDFGNAANQGQTFDGKTMEIDQGIEYCLKSCGMDGINMRVDKELHEAALALQAQAAQLAFYGQPQNHIYGFLTHPGTEYLPAGKPWAGASNSEIVMDLKKLIKGMMDPVIVTASGIQENILSQVSEKSETGMLSRSQFFKNSLSSDNHYRFNDESMIYSNEELDAVSVSGDSVQAVMAYDRMYVHLLGSDVEFGGTAIDAETMKRVISRIYIEFGGVQVEKAGSVRVMTGV